MRTAIQLNIPKPCHEDWNQMTSQEKGRFCASCKKTVFDFTMATDEVIVKTFQQEGRICGRFNPAQLQRELVLSRKNKNNFASYAASSLFAVLSLGTQAIEAQSPTRVVKVDTLENEHIVGKFAISSLSENIINGTVSDENGLPIPFVNVYIKGTSLGTTTNVEGYYSLKVKKGDTIIFSYLGYEPIEQIISNQHTYNINFKYSDVDIMGDVIIIEDLKKDHKARRRQHIRNGNIERTKVGQFLYNITNIFRRKE